MKIIHLDANTRASIVSEKATGISALFERIRSGSLPTPRTPLFKGKTEEQVFGELLKLLDRYSDRYPRLIAYEHSRLSKVGQQGGFPPLEERWDDLMKYYQRMVTAPVRKSPEYDEICQIVRKRLFGKHSLRALTVEQVLHRDIEDDKVNSNSGCPDVSKRSRVDVQQRAVEDAKSGKYKEYPALLGSRSSRLKPRFIFMFPMSTNLVEKTFVIPIMDAIRAERIPSFAAWEGFDEVEEAFNKQNAFSASFKASMDYTGMDQTMGPDQMMIVYDIVAPVFQPKYRAALKDSLLHAVNIPIMFDNWKIIVGTHGLASGSGWTNLSESIMSEFVHELINQRCTLTGNQLLGDDGAMTYNDTKIDFAQVIAECSKSCGLEANPEKQDISRYTLHYLQRFFDEDVFIDGTNIVAGVYPAVLATNAAMNPERFHDPDKWSWSMEELRWIMIGENMKHAPYFHDVLRFWMKGDKYALGTKVPGYFKKQIVQDYKVAKSITGFVPTYTESSKNRSIEDFETVKFLKSLR